MKITENLSPMMKQYLQTKENYTDAILFYRLGDFYEMFFEDAILCSRLLELTLTGKDCGLDKRAPMCGIPHHASENYIARLVDKGYKIISGGTDNHCMLVDLRTKFPELTGKVAEKVLVEADITANKNMVPFDSRSPFQTSGIRLGTPAITTRGAKEDLMGEIVEMIDTVLSNPEDEKIIASVREKVNSIMVDYPMFAY